jgi:hypothetical protein
VYATAGFFWVPYFARNLITNYVQHEMQRNISIGDLKFNPFTLTARVYKLSLVEADGSPIASFDSLLVNCELSSLIRRGVVFKEIRIEKPSVLLRVNADGSLNLTKLAPTSDATTVATTNSDPAAELPHIRIGTFALHGGRVALEDLSRPKPFTATLAPIEFSLTDFRLEPKFDNAYRFSAATPDEQRFEWSGEFSVEPLGSTGRFSLSNIKATTIASYLQDALPFDLQSGILDLRGEYAFALLDRLEGQVKLPTIEARGIGIALRANESMLPWITVPQLSIAGASLSIAERKVAVEDLHIDDAVIDAWRESDGSVNLTRLFSDGSTATSAAGEPAAESPANSNAIPWTIVVKNAAIGRARINAEDRNILPNAKFTLQPVDVKVTGYSNATKNSFAVDVSAGVNERGLLTVGGPITLSPLNVQMNIAVKDFGLAALQPYAAQSTDLTIRRGQLAAKTLLKYSAEPARGQPQLQLTGDVEVVDLLTKDNALEEDFIKWQSLKISGLDFQQTPDRLSIARIAARKPYGRVIIASNGTFNVAQVLNPTSGPQKKETTAKSLPSKQTSEQPPHQPPQQPTMAARIRSVSIEDGSASFADYSVTPSFAAEIAELKGTVEGLSSEPNSRAKVQISGSVDRYAPVSISGEVNLLSTETFSDIAMSFRNMELTTFNPYSGKFAGYNIAKGKLTTEMQYKVENRNLDAHHHVVIDQLEFGDATDSKDAVSLPIKFAVGLLKDRHGVIDLDLPVSGNIDDPKFRLGPIIWQVLKNTLEKIVTAPFALLGRLFGGGEELAFIDFPHGSSALTAEGNDKLNKLKIGMTERPQLKLDVPLLTVNDGDSAALAHTALERAVAAALPKNGDRVVALTTVYTKEFGKSPAYPPNAEQTTDKNVDVVALRTLFLEEALLTKFTATPAQLEELGRTRGIAVRDALLTNTEIAPERIFLAARTSDVKSPKDLVRMELKLE